MAIQVSKITCRIVNHPIMEHRIVVSHAGRHDLSKFVEVTVTNRDGLAGYGEAATTAMWSGESAETAKAAIDHLFAPRLEGKTFEHPREALKIMDAAAVWNSFAKAAIDTALWDLMARQQKKRVVELIADRPIRAAIPTRASVGCYDVPTSLRIAKEFWDAGIRTLKFKIGMPGFDDPSRLRAVRDALGDKPVFTVDANGAYQTEDHAVRAIEELLPFNLALVEQPTPRDRINLLARVKRRVKGVPILADEAVFTPDHLAEALDLDAFDLLSVYPGKNGGFTHSLDMIATAKKAGKPCTIGSNLETDLGQAAMAALPAALEAFPVDTLACDLPGVLYYGTPSVREPLVFRDGKIQVPTGLGFGVEPRA